MDITQIDPVKLPFRFIETLRANSEWERFTDEPFSTFDEAFEHEKLVVAELVQNCGITLEEARMRTRVAPYTKKHWHEDLIKLVMEDQDAIRRALSVLRPETLVELFK